MGKKKSAKNHTPSPSTPLPVQPEQTLPKSPRKGGEEARRLAMKYLAEGFTLSATAEVVGVCRHTIRVWRDSIQGQQELDAARKARAAIFEDAADQARRILREATPKAAQRIVDRLGSKVPFEAVTAADHLLARVGLPRSTLVQTSPDEDFDLAQLDDGEAAQLEALLAKARKKS